MTHQEAESIIYAAIRERGQSTVYDVAQAVNLTVTYTRGIVRKLCYHGDVEQVPGTFRPSLFRLPNGENDAKQIRRPVGTWRIDHPIAARSIFEVRV